ncbi:hypothetical protein E2C01_080401 [Portunus trituberculatus]|uniref:Uncharacterized protein n=1 Tax=Portunus trituberculatus TaxID=210409 RepID=A0A5B7IJM9_PORTR|nr:hypothetical protein [Portunus trituberculatus]
MSRTSKAPEIALPHPLQGVYIGSEASSADRSTANMKVLIVLLLVAATLSASYRPRHRRMALPQLENAAGEKVLSVKQKDTRHALKQHHQQFDQSFGDDGGYFWPSTAGENIYVIPQ